MDNYWMLYWFTRLDWLSSLFGLVSIVTLLIVLVLLGCWIASSVSDEDEDQISALKKWFRRVAVVCIISSAISVFMPTKNDVILIMAGGKTLDFVQADTSLAKIPAQTTKIITEYLDNALKELEKK